MNRDRVTEFGDDGGPDDMWDASGAAPDPEAVTIRFHDERVNRGLTDGLGRWSTLTDGERDVARTIGAVILAQIVEGRDPDDIADWLDDLREYWEGHKVRRRERRRDRDAVEALVEALVNEGTVRR